MNAPEEVSHECDDLIEMCLEQPVAAAEQMEFGIRQIAQIGPSRFFRHVVVVRTPDDQGRRLVFPQVFAVFREPGAVLLQSGDQVYGDVLAPWRDQRPMQLPEVGRDRIGQSEAADR